jgi:hypothetical protein
MRWRRRMCRQHNRSWCTTMRRGRRSPGSGSSAVLRVARQAEERPERRTGLEGSLEPAADCRRLALAGGGASSRSPVPVVSLHPVLRV